MSAGIVVLAVLAALAWELWRQEQHIHLPAVHDMARRLLRRTPYAQDAATLQEQRTDRAESFDHAS